MARITNGVLCCAVVLLLSFNVRAQLSGTYNVPNNFPTLSAAIAALNTQGVSAPVFIEINAGYTETAPAGGYSLSATGTALNPITFRRTGPGANPLITAYTGGSATPASAVQDGVWRFIGSDYITVDGIDITDPNAANPATMEYGFGFFKASTTNGCQNNTIQNCVISLKTINNALGSGPAADGSRGINVVNSLPTTQASAVTPVSFAGTNSNNRFYRNTIRNCNIGIALIGYAAPSPFTLADTGNDIGGTSLATGNTILNFGGAASAANAAAGIRTLAQYNLNVSQNVLNNNDGSGANHVNVLRGIYVNTAQSANVTIANNTVTVKSGGAAVQTSAIENVAGATAANNTVSITGNLVLNCSNTANTTASFIGIFNNGASASYLEINNNRFSGLSTFASSGSNYLVYNTGAVPVSISMNANVVESCTNTSSSSGAYFMLFNNVVSSAALSISSNTLDGNTSISSTGATHLIYNAAATAGTILQNGNTISNNIHSASSTGAFYGIYNNGTSSGALEQRNNAFVNHRVTAFSGAIHFIYNTAAIAAGITMQGNTAASCTSSITSTGSFYGIYNNAASSTNLVMSNNTFSAHAFAATTGSIHLLFNRGATTNTFVSTQFDNNLVTGCSFSATSSAPFLGIYNSGVTSGNLSLSNNTITTNTWLTSTAIKYMLFNTGVVNTVLDMNNNLIAGCTVTNNTTGAFHGINNAGACNSALNINGNIFRDITNRATTGGTYLMINTGAVPGGAITFTNNAVINFTTASTGLADFYGISNSGTTYSTLEVTANTYSNSNITSFSGPTNLVYNTGAVSTNISRVNLSNNLVTGCTSSVSSNGSFFGIYNNAASCQSLNISANIFTNHSAFANNGANHFIYNRGALTNTFSAITLQSNLFSNCTHSATSNASFYTLWNNGVTSDVTSIRSNTITASTWASASNLRYLISNWGVATVSADLSDNLVSNCTHTANTTGSLFGIYNNNNVAVSSGDLRINNNRFIGNTTSASTGETHFINTSGVTTNTFNSIEITGNLLSYCSSSVTSTGPYYGIYNNSSSALNVNISQNTYTSSSLVAVSGSNYFVFNRAIAGNVFGTATMSNNLVSDLTYTTPTGGSWLGIVNSGVATSSCSLLSIINNTFTSMNLSGPTSQIHLVNNSCPVTNSISISDNLFTNLTNTLTTTAAFFGINNSGASPGGDLNISRNRFTNLVSAATSAARYLVYNSAAISNSITISQNLVSNCTHTKTANGALYYFQNNSGGLCQSVSITSNTLNGNSVSFVNGSVYAVLNSASNATYTTNEINISGNTVNNQRSEATSGGNYYGMANTCAGTNLSIQSNSLTGSTAAAAGHLLLYNSGKLTGTISVQDNLLAGYTHTIIGGGNFYGVYNTVNYANSTIPASVSIVNNRILNTACAATNGNVYFINNSGSTTNTISTVVISNNLVSNVSSSATTGAWYGLFNSSLCQNSLSVNTNTFTNMDVGTTSGVRTMIYNGGITLNSADVSANLVSGLTSTTSTTGSYYAINNGGNAVGPFSISNNRILDHTLTATSGSAHAVYTSGIISGSLSITGNLVSRLSHSASSIANNGGFGGIYVTGGNSAALTISANTFTNLNLFAATGPNYLVFNRMTSSGTVSAVSVDNNLFGNISYTSTSGAFCGVLNFNAAFGSLAVNSNTFLNVSSTSTTGAGFMIYNTGAGSVSASITNNQVNGFANTGNTTGTFYGIINGAAQPELNIRNNRLQNFSMGATTGSLLAIYNTGVVSNTIAVENNLVSGITHSATTSGGFTGLFNNAASSANLSISTNSLSALSLTTTSGGTHFIYNRGAASSTIAAMTISNNAVSAVSHSAGSGPFYGIFNNGTSHSGFTISTNRFSGVNSISTTSPRYMIYNTGVGSGDLNITGNTISNYASSLNTTGLFYNVFNTGSLSATANLNISSNTFSAEVLPSTTGAIYGIYNTALVTGSASVNSNTIAGITHSSTTGNFACIYNTGHAQNGFAANGNVIDNISQASATGTCYVICNTGSVTTQAGMSNNQVTNLQSNLSGATGAFFGLYNLTSSSFSSLAMNGNKFSNTSVSVSALGTYLLYHTGTAANTINSISISNNTVTGLAHAAGSGNFYGVFNNSVSSSSLSLSGNALTNYSSTTTNSARYMVYNTGSVTAGMDMSNNAITGYTSAVNTQAGFYGVHNSASSGGGLDMNANTVSSCRLEATTGDNFCIYNSGAVANAIRMNNNVVSGNTNSLVSTGVFYGIRNQGTAAALNMDMNTLTGNSSGVSTGNTYLLFNSGVVSNSVSIFSNNLGHAFTNNSIDYSGTFYNIFNNAGAATTTLAINGNNFSNYAFTGIAGTGNIYFISNTNNGSRLDVSGNTWSGVTLNHNGNEYLIYNPSSTSGQVNITGNTVSGYTRTANAAAMYCYYANGSSSPSCIQNISGNIFTNIAATNLNTGSFYGIYNMDGSGGAYPQKHIFNNSITNVNYRGLGFFYGYYVDLLGHASNAGSTLHHNTLSNIQWEGPAEGIHIGSNVSVLQAAEVYSNTVQSMTTTGTSSELYGAYLMGSGKGVNFYKNKISELTASGTSGVTEGVRVANASTTRIYNNLIGNLSTPVSSVQGPMNGINITGGTQVGLYYNTVYLAATNGAGNFGSNALYAAAPVSLELRNNILINTSTPTGTGVTCAFRRTAGSMSTYSATSNNNLFYAGTPAINRLIFSNSPVNSFPTLPGFQAFVSPRDNASISENVNFISTAGPNPNFLHVNAGLPSLTESGAQNVAGISDDYDWQVRQGNPGYSGTGSAPDIGADEYNQSLTSCASATAGTISVPLASVVCEGQTAYMLSTGYTAAGDIVHQWRVATNPNGPYSNVTGGTGANYVAYTTPTLAPGTYYYVMVTTCTIGSQSNTSNQVTVTVKPAPSVTAAVLNPAICSGNNLEFSSTSNIGTNYNWQGPNNFTAAIQNPTVANATTNSSGTYTLLVSDASCTSMPVYVNVTVNPTPPSFYLSPAGSSICIGGSQTLTASIPITSPTLNFGIQATQNGPSGAPAPYSVYYGGQKMQMLILAAELSAVGFTTGTPIQSIQFPVVSLGANWGGSLHENQNFMVGIKATTVSALSAFETGISNVAPATNFTPVVGFNNVHNFSSPFIWDGSSNLVVETVFSNSVIGTTGNAVIQYNSPTGFQSTLVYRADNQDIATVASAPAPNTNVGFVRPDFRLNGTLVGTYTWSPATALSATSGPSVIASPTTASLYSVTLTNGQCASNATVSLEVIPMPTVMISSSSQTVCIGNTATLTATGANTYTWNNGSNSSSIVVNPFATTTYTLYGSNPICPSTSTTVQITSAPALTLATAASPQVICAGKSSTLTASGAATYSWTGLGTTASVVVTPAVSTNYTINATSGPGCWTSKIVNVKVNALPVVSITPASASICAGESIAMEASGVFSFTWTPGGSNSPILTASPATLTTYTVVGADLNNCVNFATVTIDVNACTGLASVAGELAGVQVYPNPSTGMVNVRFSSQGEKRVYVENAIGAQVYAITTEKDTEQIDLSAYAKGVYFVKVTSAQFSGSFKVILE